MPPAKLLIRSEKEATGCILGLLGLLAFAVAPFLVPTERETRWRSRSSAAIASSFLADPCPAPPVRMGPISLAGRTAR
jgi:hypothetical protein